MATHSTRLHELYVDGLGGAEQPMTPAMALALQANFGSVERWRADFAALGSALAGGAGWVLLSFRPREGTLVNQWAADDGHAHADAVTGSVPILALDLDAQAHHPDLGAAAGPCVAAFIDDIRWATVHERYQRAVHDASDELAASPDDLAGAKVLDVRRAGVYEQAADIIPGSRWHDPADIDRWAPSLPRDEAVVVYCVYGHEVGRSTALRLHAAGVKARFLKGGIEGWKAAGRTVAAGPTGRGSR